MAGARSLRRRHGHLFTCPRFRIPHCQAHEHARRTVRDALADAFRVAGQEIRRRWLRCCVARATWLLKRGRFRRQRCRGDDVVLRRWQKRCVIATARLCRQAEGGIERRHDERPAERFIRQRQGGHGFAPFREILGHADFGFALRAAPPQRHARNRIAVGKPRAMPAAAGQELEHTGGLLCDRESQVAQRRAVADGNRVQRGCIAFE